MIKIGIVGAGSIAKAHSKAILNNEDCILTAVCDTIEERAAEIAQIHNAEVFTDYKEMCEKADMDAVILAVSHKEYAELKKEIIFGTVLRTVIVPLIGLGIAFLFFRNIFSGAHFAAFVAAFATPVAVSSVPMAQEMGSDSQLAGQLVVWSTLVSAFTVFLASFILKSAGIF